MRDRKDRQFVQEAIDSGLSSLRGDPWLARKIMGREGTAADVKTSKKAPLLLIIVVLLLMLTATALAVSRIMLSPRVDAKALANRALEEKYGLTTAMLGFFSQDTGGADGRHWRVDYFADPDLEKKLGNYQVLITDGHVEQAVWTLDGKNTAGGFDAEAWGAEQLGEMVRITSVTHDMRRFHLLVQGEAVDVYEGMEELETDPLPEEYEAWMEETDQVIRAEQELFLREIEEAGRPYQAQSRFTQEELIALGRQGIIQAYQLDEDQQQRLRFENTFFFPAHYSGFGLDDHPVYHMTFQAGYEGGWQPGDGIYTVVVSALDGTVEYLDYDTTLNGNG